MSPTRAALADYLTLRRALGYQLERPARLLHEFVDYLEGRGLDHITVDAAMDWAMGAGPAPRTQAARRLSAVRLFARYLSALDPRTEIPPSRLLPQRVERKAPYLFSDAEIEALLGAARSLDEPFRALTIETLIGLLSCTGLRPMEATHLACADVQLAEAALLVRDSKWGVSRIVPLHPTAVAVLERYQDVQRALFRDSRSPGLFMWSATRRLSTSLASGIFRHLLIRAGIVSPPGRRPPRLYDLRHRFAITTLVGWYRHGVDVESALPALSTYMGHLRPKDTYWYLEAVPELLQAATGRLEQFLEDRP